MSNHQNMAKILFERGNNCAQAVFVPYVSDWFDEDAAFRIASSFGGGMGGMENVCGAVTGMFMAAGLQKGYGEIPANADPQASKEPHNERIRAMAEAFREKWGSLICKELKEKIEADGEWKSRSKPCLCYVLSAVEILERTGK